MPRRQQYTTSSTLVLHVLGRAYQVRNTSEAREAAETSGPGTIICVSNHLPFSACAHWRSQLLTASCFPSQTPYSSCSSARTLDNPQAQVHAPDSQSESRPGTRCRWAAGAACRAVGWVQHPWAEAACRSPGGALAGAASRQIGAGAAHIAAAGAALVAARSAQRWGLDGRRGVVDGHRLRREIGGIAAWVLEAG
jgi:hypothetical protein